MLHCKGWIRCAATAAVLVGCGTDGDRPDPFSEASSLTAADSGHGDTAGDADAGESATDSGSDADESGSDADDGDPGGCPGGPAVWNEVVAQAQAHIDAQGIPGAAMAVLCDGVLTHAAGIGAVDAQGGPPVTAATRFQLASVTKMFTAAAAVALAEQGVLDLHAPVGAVFPSVGYGSITLHDLLTHTASYPTEFATFTSDDLVTTVLDNGSQPMWAPAGAVWNYSNPGFAVAGAVLEQASGLAFADLLETIVFAPAGMSRATMKVSTVLAQGDYAWGHTGSPGASTAIAPDGSYYDSGPYGPQGGAWSSVEDLAHWGEVHMQSGGAVLSAAGAASLAEFHTRTAYPDEGYGYGLFVEAYYDPQVLSHGGSVPGFVADWRIVPELGFGAFVVINADWADPTAITQLITDAYVQLGDQGGTPMPTALGDYVGTYADPYELGTITVLEQDGQLMANVNGSTEPMTEVWDDTFTMFHPVAGYEIDVTFWRDDGPQAQYLVSIWGIATRT